MQKPDRIVKKKIDKIFHADWRKSDSSVDGKPQGNWRWNSNSRDVVASFPSFSRPAARAPEELARRLPLPLPRPMLGETDKRNTCGPFVKQELKVLSTFP